MYEEHKVKISKSQTARKEKGFDLHTSRVEIKSDCAGPLTRIMSRLYAELAVIPPPPRLVGYPLLLEEYIKIIYQAHKASVTLEVKELRSECETRAHLAANNTKAVIGYSGGKDSLATAIWCRQHNIEPVLFHVSSINGSTTYPDEVDVARKAAKKIDMELVVVDAKLKGKNDYKENPTKDQLILAMMVDFGVLRGISKYSMGVEVSNAVDKSNILYNWSDAKEMFDAWNKFVKGEFYQAYEWFWVIEDLTQSIKLVVDYNVDLLDYTIGCMMPYRYRAMRHEGNEKKFGIKLRPNRCGSCWKCACEHLNLVALGVEERHERFTEHCMTLFEEKMPIIYGNGYKEGAPRSEILKVAVNPKLADIERLGL